MHTKVIVDGKTIIIPFSTLKTAMAFVRGFNDYRRAYIQGQDYPSATPLERRGAYFAHIIMRYSRVNEVAIGPDELQIFEDKKVGQSLFDGFE